MKSLIILLISWIFIQPAISQMHNLQSRNSLSIDLGTDKQNQPQSSIAFRTAIQNHVIYSVQLKSLNTYYLISQQEHTLKPQAEFYYHPGLSHYTFLFGIGSSIYLENPKYRNTISKNTFEPFISSTIIGSICCLRYQIPVQLFASDKHSGIRFYPEIAYRYKGNSSIYLRGEFILDNYAVQQPKELYQQVHLGIQKMF